MSEFESVFGATLRQGKTEVATVASLSAAKFTGIYFGAHWAPPCRLFTKTLTEFYGEANKESKRFEVVFVSVDGNEAAFERNYAEMPWFAVEYKDQARIASLKQRYGINGLPTLVIIDQEGQQVNDDGRQDILNNNLEALDMWEKIRTQAQQQ